MGAYLKAHLDLLGGDRHLGGGVDEIAEDVSALGCFVAVADAVTEDPLEAAGQLSELQVAVNLHRHGRRERVHMEECRCRRRCYFR